MDGIVMKDLVVEFRNHQTIKIARKDVLRNVHYNLNYTSKEKKRAIERVLCSLFHI